MIPIGNAAGFVKTPDDLEPLLSIPPAWMSSITLGTYSLEEGFGNSGRVFWNDDTADPTSLNAVKLKNPGVLHNRKELAEMARRIYASGKLPRISIWAENLAEYAELFRAVLPLGFSTIEFDPSSPNASSDISAFDNTFMRKLLELIDKQTTPVGEPSIAMKMPPFSNPSELRNMAKLFAEYAHVVDYVVSCNSFARGLAFDDAGHPVLDSEHGFGGVGGAALRFITLGQIAQWREELPPAVGVIAVGGLRTLRHVRDAGLAGACSAQLGTNFKLAGASIFGPAK